MVRTLKRALEALNDSSDKLRSISPDLDRLLGLDENRVVLADADPLGCADKIHEMIEHFQRTIPLIDALPREKRSVEKEREIAVNMAIDVLRALKEYGIKPAATAEKNSNYISPAVQILKAIGDDIHLTEDVYTWKNYIVDAKKSARDLQSRQRPHQKYFLVLPIKSRCPILVVV